MELHGHPALNFASQHGGGRQRLGGAGLQQHGGAHIPRLQLQAHPPQPRSVMPAGAAAAAAAPSSSVLLDLAMLGPTQHGGGAQHGGGPPLRSSIDLRSGHPSTRSITLAGGGGGVSGSTLHSDRVLSGSALLSGGNLSVSEMLQERSELDAFMRLQVTGLCYSLYAVNFVNV